MKKQTKEEKRRRKIRMIETIPRNCQSDSMRIKPMLDDAVIKLYQKEQEYHLCKKNGTFLEKLKTAFELLKLRSNFKTLREEYMYCQQNEQYIQDQAKQRKKP